MSTSFSLTHVVLMAVLVVIAATTTSCVYASAAGKNDDASMWSCPTLVEDGDDPLREPTSCIHFNLQGRKGTLVHIPFADLTLEAATRVFLHNYFGGSSEVEVASSASSCVSSSAHQAHFSSPRTPLSPTFIEMVAAGVFRSRWVLPSSNNSSSRIKGLEKSAYDCLSQQQHRHDQQHNPSSLATIDDIVSVERGVFTGDLFLGRTPGGEIIEGLSDGEDDDYGDASEGPPVVAPPSSPQQQQGGNIGAKSSLSWGDGDGMLIYSQDSFVDPFKPTVPSTSTATATTSSSATSSQQCVMNTTKTTNCRNEEIMITCAPVTENVDNNGLVTLLRGLPVSFDTSTSRYVSGHHFDEIHFSTHITLNPTPTSTSENIMKKRIRVTAIVSLDIVNEAPVAIDSTVQVQVPAATTSTLSISIPVDFQHFKAYDADFQKLRNDFELHHINLIDKVPIAVVGGGAGVVCSTDNGAPTEGHPTTTAATTRNNFGDNAALQGSASVTCQLLSIPTTTTTTASVTTVPLNISWSVLQRPCGEGVLKVSTPAPADSSSSSSSSSSFVHRDPTPANAASQGSPASMPRCLDGASRADGGSVHSESLVVTVTSTTTTNPDLLHKLLEAGGVSVSFPFMVWDSEGVPSKHLAHTTLHMKSSSTTTAASDGGHKKDVSPLQPLPLATSETLMKAFSQSASSNVIRPVRLSDGSSFYIPSLPTPTTTDGVDEQMLKVVAVVASCEGGDSGGGMFQLRSTGRPLRVGDVLLGSKGGLDGLVQYVPCVNMPTTTPTVVPSDATASSTSGGTSESLTATLQALSKRVTVVVPTTSTCTVCHSSMSFRTATGETFTVQSPSSSSATTPTTPKKVHKHVQDVSIVLPTPTDSDDACAPVDIPVSIPYTTTTSLHLLSSLSNTSWLRSPPSSSSSSGGVHLGVTIGTTTTTTTSAGCATTSTMVVVRITPHPYPSSQASLLSCQHVWRYANMLSNTNAVETFTLLVGGGGGGGSDGLPIVLQVNVRLERRMEGSSAPTVRILPSTSSPSSDTSITVLRIDHGPKDRSPLTIGAQEQVSLAVRRSSTTTSNHGALDATLNSQFGVVKDGLGSAFGVASATFGADAFGQALLPVSHVVTVTTPTTTTTATTITGVVTDTATMSSTAPLAAVMEFSAAVRLLLSSLDTSSSSSAAVTSIHSTSAMCLWLSQQGGLMKCVSVVSPTTGAQTTTLSIPLRRTSAFHCDTITTTSSSSSPSTIYCAFHITVVADTMLALFQQVVTATTKGFSSLVGVEYVYASKVGVVEVRFDATLPTLTTNGGMARFLVTRSPPTFIRNTPWLSSSSSSLLSSKRLYSTTSSTDDSSSTTPQVAISIATETSADVVVIFTPAASSPTDGDGALLGNSTISNSTDNNTTDPNATATNTTTLPPPPGNPDESGEYDPDHPDGYHIAKACLTVAGVFALLLLVKYQQMLLCAQYFMRSFRQSNALRQATREATRRVHKRKRAKPNNKKRLIVNEGDTSEDGLTRRSSSFLSFFGVQHSAFSDDDEYEVESDEEGLPPLPEPHSEFIGGSGIHSREEEGVLLGGASGGVAIEMEVGSSSSIVAKKAGTVDAHQIIGAPPSRRSNNNNATTNRHRATIASVPTPTTTTSNNNPPTATTGFEGMFTPREEAEEDLGDSFGQYRRASIFVGGKQQQQQQQSGGAPQTYPPSTTATTSNSGGAARPTIKTAAPPSSSVWSEGTTTPTPSTGGQKSPVQTVPPPQRRKKADNTSDVISGDSQN